GSESSRHCRAAGAWNARSGASQSGSSSTPYPDRIRPGGYAMTTDVSFAVQADLDALTDTLTDAFSADPMMAWIYPDASTRSEMLRPFMRLALDVSFPHGHVYSVAN